MTAKKRFLQMPVLALIMAVLLCAFTARGHKAKKFFTNKFYAQKTGSQATGSGSEITISGTGAWSDVSSIVNNSYFNGDGSFYATTYCGGATTITCDAQATPETANPSKAIVVQSWTGIYGY